MKKKIYKDYNLKFYIILFYDYLNRALLYIKTEANS